MKTVYFKSDAYSDVFSSNNAHKFTVSIKEELLNYQSNSNHPLINTAVKSISFRVTKRPQTTQVLALRSDLKTEHTCFGSRYESIVSTFLLKDKGEQFASFHPNSIFIPSSIQKLTSCSFSLCNLEDESDTLSYIDKVSPTIVEVWVKSRKEPRAIMQPFHIFVKSSDVESKEIFPYNTNTDFKFQLTEHKLLSGKWVILLRNLIVSRKFFNIPDDTSFKIRYVQFDYEEHTSGLVTNVRNKIDQTVSIPAGYYADEETFVTEVSALLNSISSWQLQLSYNTETNKCLIDMAEVEEEENRINILHMSGPLAIALGFAREVDGNTSNNVKLRLQPDEDAFLQSDYEMQIFHKQPKQVLLNCNIIEPSLFGSKITPILQLIPINGRDVDDDIIYMSFPEHSYKDLAVTSFGHLHFWFEDENGGLLQMDENANSTYITLSFVKLT